MKLPKLLIPVSSYERMMSYVLGCDTEITGFADIFYNEGIESLVVGNVYLLKQEATGVEVEMDDEAIAHFNDACLDAGMTQLPQLWWHSHVNMQAYFSGTDAKAMEDLKNDSYSVALVLNKKYDMMATLRQYAPVDLKEDLEIMIIPDMIVPSPAILAEIAEKVSIKKEPVAKTKYVYKAPDDPFNKPIITYRKHLVSSCEKPNCEICIEYYAIVEAEWADERGGHYE